MSTLSVINPSWLALYGLPPKARTSLSFGIVFFYRRTEKHRIISLIWQASTSKEYKSQITGHFFTLVILLQLMYYSDILKLGN